MFSYARPADDFEIQRFQDVVDQTAHLDDGKERSDTKTVITCEGKGETMADTSPRGEQVGFFSPFQLRCIVSPVPPHGLASVLRSTSGFHRSPSHSSRTCHFLWMPLLPPSPISASSGRILFPFTADGATRLLLQPRRLFCRRAEIWGRILGLLRREVVAAMAPVVGSCPRNEQQHRVLVSI